MSLVIVLAFVVLMVLAIPVGHGLIIASGAAILWDGGVPLMIVAQQMFEQTQSFPMLALPFFMLAGALMMGGRLGKELLDFASEGMKRWTGRRALDHGRRLRGLRRRLGQGGRQRLGARLRPDPLAEEPRLSRGPLRGEQRHLGRHRHPDPALHPDDPLRARQRHERRRPVRRRASCPAS